MYKRGATALTSNKSEAKFRVTNSTGGDKY